MTSWFWPPAGRTYHPILLFPNRSFWTSLTRCPPFIICPFSPRKHPAPGNDLKNVCYLRSPDDGNHIAEVANKKNVVIIGNSFIGNFPSHSFLEMLHCVDHLLSHLHVAMEVAAYFAEKANSISIVARSDVPFKYSLGPEIGARIKKVIIIPSSRILIIILKSAAKFVFV